MATEQWGWYSVRDGALDIVEPCNPSAEWHEDGEPFIWDDANKINMVFAASLDDAKMIIKALDLPSDGRINHDEVEAIKAIYRYRVARGEAPPVEVRDGE